MALVPLWREKMLTFGEFFGRLRRRIEKTGRTDRACGDMDAYKSSWRRIADQELSYSNLLEFSAEMTQAGIKRLVDKVNSDRFDPKAFCWELDSVHEFHHAMLEEAGECGLDVEHLSNWLTAREERLGNQAVDSWVKEIVRGASNPQEVIARLVARIKPNPSVLYVKAQGKDQWDVFLGLRIKEGGRHILCPR
jgi:hypothetical protein